MGFVWDSEKQIGYYPVNEKEYPYNAAYFDKYAVYSRTKRGREITDFRVSLVENYAPGLPVLDVGVGCGSFVQAMQDRGRSVFGYDINPKAVEWLKRLCFYRDIEYPIEVMTFWDSFEHLPKPEIALRNVKNFAIMSIPVFADEAHVLRSKHFRTDEHYWYFTEEGLFSFMHDQGFSMIGGSNRESLLGREDIFSYIFTRSHNPLTNGNSHA